jgi:hypothetical protein
MLQIDRHANSWEDGAEFSLVCFRWRPTLAVCVAKSRALATVPHQMLEIFG